MKKPLYYLLAGLTLFCSTVAKCSNPDSLKKERFFGAVNVGVGQPVFNLSSTTYDPKQNVIGFANLGMQYSAFIGADITHHFGVMGMFSYNVNRFDTLDVNSDLTNTFSSTRFTGPGTTQYYPVAAYQYISSDEFWKSYNALAGVYFKFSKNHVAGYLRALVGYSFCTSPGITAQNTSYYQNETQGTKTTNYYYLAPAHTGALCFDIGGSLKYSFNKWFSALLNVDLLFSDHMLFNANLECRGNSATTYIPTGYSTSAYKEPDGSYTFTSAVSLINTSVGVCFSLVK